jgi:hypothetical protein
MTDTETETEDVGGTVWDAPNQQVVREDESPPWEEGSGAGGNPDPQDLVADEEAGDLTLDEMTKQQLLEYAQSKGYSPANAAMSKDEIRATIDENEG